MNTSNVMPKEEQDRFWRIVRQCIRAFHVDRAEVVLAEAARLRKKVGGMTVEELEMFYHAEPFDVACNLAGRPLDVKLHLKKYLSIRDGDGVIFKPKSASARKRTA